MRITQRTARGRGPRAWRRSLEQGLSLLVAGMLVVGSVTGVQAQEGGSADVAPPAAAAPAEAAAPAQIAADQVVSDCANDVDLRAAILDAQANAGGTITFDCGTEPVTITLDGTVLPTITGPIVVDGGGRVTLDAAGDSRIFLVNPGGALTLRNLTLTGGFADGDGGAVFSANSSALTVENSLFTGNETTLNGSGGALVAYGPLNITNSEFASNKGANGGAVYPRHGAVVSIAGSSFHDNSVHENGPDQLGGAILIWDGPEVTITSSTFENNRARLGGAIYVVLPSSTLTVSGSTLRNNRATLYGGALYNEGAATLSNSLLHANSTETAQGDATPDSGGAIYSTGTLALSNVTLHGNSSSYGSALYNAAGASTLAFATVTGNSSNPTDGSTLFAKAGSIDLGRTIVAESTPAGGSCAVSEGTITSSGYNVGEDNSCNLTATGDQVTGDPRLGPLADNGGPTQTRLPLSGSPALEAVPTGACSLAADQRGTPRPQGLQCDAGAVEVESPPLSCGGSVAANADATLDEGAPGSAFGAEAELWVARSGGSERHALLRFDLTGLPADLALSHAELELPVGGASDMAAQELAVQEVVAAWDEATVTWASAPAARYTYDPETASAYGGFVRLNVTPLVARWLNGEAPPAGLRVVPAGAGDSELRIASREGSEPPRLTVYCTPRFRGNPPDRKPTDDAQIAAIAQLTAASTIAPLLKLGVQGGVQKATFRVAIPESVGADGNDQARWFMGQYRALLRLQNPDTQMQLITRGDTDDNLRYRQLLDGIPVEAAELVVHLAGDQVVGLTGAYLPDLVSLGAPTLNAATAAQIARAQNGPGAETLGEPQLRYMAQVAYALDGDPRTDLAWLVSVGGAEHVHYLVDAFNGDILATMPKQTTVFDLAVFRAFGSGPTTNCASPLTTSGTAWYTEDGRTQGAAFDADADAAFNTLRNTYNFFRNVAGIRRDGLDGNGGLIRAYTGVGSPWVNAQFWCGQMEFGTGFVTQDIVTHEYAHGLMNNTVDLIYRRESGALNESVADIFGYALDPDDWTIGEDLAGGTLRDMEFPARFAQPDTFANFQSFAATVACGAANDNCGVHNNSGIHNKAAQLLIEGGTFNGFTVAGMGRNKTVALYYNVLRNNQITTAGTFQNMRDGMLALIAQENQPQVDLGLGYDYSAADECRIRNAYAAVGVGLGDSDCDGTENNAENSPWDDRDGDGIQNQFDRCPDLRSPDNNDLDADGVGDVCDADDDNDRICDIDGPFGAQPGAPNGCQQGQGRAGERPFDNCERVANQNQIDSDGDNRGDACDDDPDGDGRANGADNCPTVKQGVVEGDWNDTDADGFGNVCDVDSDADGICDFGGPVASGVQPSAPAGCSAGAGRNSAGRPFDVCRYVANPGQEDTTESDRGLAKDGVGDACDLCPAVSSPDNLDTDKDGVGNPCDRDADNDHICSAGGPFPPGADGVVADPLRPTIGCEPGPLRVTAPFTNADNCPLIANRDQRDDDRNGLGFACDSVEQAVWRAFLGERIRRYRLIPRWGVQRFPIPVCPQCADELPFNFQSVINVVVPQGYSVQVVDNFGSVQTKLAGVTGLQTLRFKPLATALRVGGAAGTFQAAEAGSLQAALQTAAETSYFLEFVPDATLPPDTPIEVDIGVVEEIDGQIYLPLIDR